MANVEAERRMMKGLEKLVDEFGMYDVMQGLRDIAYTTSGHARGQISTRSAQEWWRAGGIIERAAESVGKCLIPK